VTLHQSGGGGFYVVIGGSSGCRFKIRKSFCSAEAVKETMRWRASLERLISCRTELL
jgi:hypothetical protein